MSRFILWASNLDKTQMLWEIFFVNTHGDNYSNHWDFKWFTDIYKTLGLILLVSERLRVY